jgi:hypothetical protein
LLGFEDDTETDAPSVHAFVVLFCGHVGVVAPYLDGLVVVVVPRTAAKRAFSNGL